MRRGKPTDCACCGSRIGGDNWDAHTPSLAVLTSRGSIRLCILCVDELAEELGKLRAPKPDWGVSVPR